MPLKMSVSTSGLSRRVSCLIRSPSLWLRRNTSATIASLGLLDVVAGETGFDAPACRRRRIMNIAAAAAAPTRTRTHQNSAKNPGAVENWNVFDWPIVFPARSRAVGSIATKYVVPDCKSRAGTNVTTRESELHTNVPSIAGVIENARSTEERSIGSLKVTTIHGVRFVFAPAGRDSVTTGGVTSTRVQVSFVAGAVSTLPARSRAIDRNA